MVGLLALLGPLVTLCSKIGEWLADPIKNQFGYFFNYKTNINKLRDGVQNLENIRSSIQQSVDAAMRNLETIKPDVLGWLKEVDDLKHEADKVLQATGVGVQKGFWCFGGQSTNIKSRYSLSKKARNMTELVLEFQDKCKFTKLSDPPLPVEITDFIHLSYSEGFGSRVSTRNEIMESLKDDGVSVIGVCGMGGVGKTTMAKEVGARAKLEHLFDVVVMVDITQAPNKKTIQSNIAELLGLKLQEESLMVRAARISARLKMLARVLIILDDIWSRLDLEEVGIPFGCKMLLTSRSINACNQMKADRIFKIRVMPMNEAWLLFKRSAEKSFLPDPNLHQVARDIVEECGGLPLAIVTIARALEGEKEKSMWDDALQRLRSNDLEGEYASVYSSLEVTFNFLESDEMKHVFLLCCLFPEGHDISIEDLLRLGLGLSLFKKTDGVSEARIRTNAFIQKLKNLNLLLEGGDEQSVKLHNLVRDSGLKIASKNNHVFIVKHGDGLKFWPTECTDEYCTSISLRCDEMSELPEKLNFPKLELLLLVGGDHPLEFPTGFYDNMAELKVVVLRGMLIQSYPASFEVSTRLRNLSLEYCTFDKTSDISMIGILVTLETLSFLHSDVKQLPIEIGNLTRLKVLDLTGCGDLFNIAPGVLERLIKLEELYMRGTLVKWPDEQITTCIRELNSLSQLTAFEIELFVYDLLPYDLIIFRRLNRFRVCIGLSIENKIFQNTLKVRFPTLWEDGGLEVLFNKTEILHLHGWRLLKNSILNNPKRASILMSRNLKLEYCDLRYLTELCHGQYHETAVGEITVDETEICELPLFGNLHDLEIVHCDNLTSVFSLSAPTDFVKLESLKIIGCEMIEEIFLKTRDQDEKSAVKIELPNLKCLILDNLPHLNGFCKHASSLVLPQLLEFRLHSLPKFQELNIIDDNQSSTDHSVFNQKILLAMQLKVLSISKMKINEILKYMLPDSCFVNLRVISLTYCDDLSSVVLSDMLKKTNGLKILHVEGCGLVQVVFDLQMMLTKDHAFLNNLTDLELEKLPNMTHIWKHGPETFNGFQNLTKLSVAGCHQLTYLLSHSIASVLSNLQELSITECRRMIVILVEGNELDAKRATWRIELAFPRLRSIELIDLPEMRCFCLELHDFQWPLLESVWIDCCKEMMIFTGGTSSTPKLKEISINGRNHTIEQDLNTDLQRLQQQSNDGNTSDSTFTSSVIE